MVRPRKMNKIPMTTVSVSEYLLREMIKVKSAGQTWNDFINKIFRERQGLKEEISDLKESIENYDQIIKVKEKKIGELLQLNGLVR